MIWKKFTTVIILYSSSNKENFVKRVREKSHPEMGGSIYTQEKIKKPPVMYVYPSRRFFFCRTYSGFGMYFQNKRRLYYLLSLLERCWMTLSSSSSFCSVGQGSSSSIFLACSAWNLANSFCS